jgi:hypothetical protein
MNASDFSPRQLAAIKAVREKMDGQSGGSNTAEFNPVTRPRHYCVAGIEVRDIQRDLCGELQGMLAADYANGLKYLLRALRKERPIQDLSKAKFHIDALIEGLEELDAKNQ